MRGEEDLVSWMHLSDTMFVNVERGGEAISSRGLALEETYRS